MSRIHLCAVFLLCAAAHSVASGKEPGAATCRVTPGKQQNDALMAWVPESGQFVFEPGGPGFIEQDGAMGIKFGWAIMIPGELTVGGRRLDGHAPPARSYFAKGSMPKTGGRTSYLVFPTPGCWEITGKVGDRSLSFVVDVEKIGDGPSWRYQLPTDGSWYSTEL